jgi:hypothetical protein
MPKLIQVQTEVEQKASTSCEVDEEKLAEWLKRIYPSVKKELDDISNSKAFKGYKVSTDSSDANCKLVQTISVSSQMKDGTIVNYISSNLFKKSNIKDFFYFRVLMSQLCHGIPPITQLLLLALTNITLGVTMKA